MSNSVLCLDIGGSFIKSAVSPALGQLVMPRQRAMPLSSWPAFVYAVQEIIAQYGDAISEQSPLALSCAGVVDVANDRILSSNIPPFAGIDITRSLQAELGCPVAMANDADCFTLAEARFGAAKDLPVVLGVILGSGIGGGIAINGNILYGNQGIGASGGTDPLRALICGELSCRGWPAAADSRAASIRSAVQKGCSGCINCSAVRR